MMNWPNFISLLRFPLAFVFFLHDPVYRGLAIVLAAISDGLDGYLARKYRQTSHIGACLDPIMDKFFVFIALMVLLQEQKLVLWQAFALMGRDVAVLGFGGYLTYRKRLLEYRVRAIWWGKVATALQFVVLLWLVFSGSLPDFIYYPFILFALLAFRELFVNRHVVLSTFNKVETTRSTSS